MRNTSSKKTGSAQLDLFSQPKAEGPDPVWSVVVGGRRIPYTLRRSARARNVWLRFGIGTGLEVVAPERMSLRNLDSIIEKKQPWLEKQLGRIGISETVLQSRKPKHGARLPYMGTEYTLRVEVDAGRHVSVSVDGSEIVAVVPDRSAEALREVIRGWYKSMARKVIPERVSHLADGRKVGTVSIRDQKTRWGSCSPKGNLSFNWRLVMAPPRIIDYLIVHELCHMEHPDHSGRFWSKVAKHCPEYKEREAWLKEHGRGLHV